MRWIEIVIETTSDASDAICEMLAQLGADGIAVYDPEEIKGIILSPDSLSYADDAFFDAMSDTVNIRAYFAEFADGIRLGAKADEYKSPDGVGKIYGQIASGVHSLEEVLSIILQELERIKEFLPIGKGFTEYHYVQDEDWANSWKQYYEVLAISPRVTICPSWEQVDKKDGEVVVMLDPGSAFGTGTHETTSMCAEVIDEIITKDEVVLDLGCGSGILAIIAEKLGAAYVEAIDIDQLATNVAVDNCVKNDVNVVCHTGELCDAHRHDYTLIVANIIADILVLLSPQIADYLAPDGHFLISGIIDTKAQMVLAACEASGLTVIQSKKKGDWHAYLLSKKHLV